MGTREEDMREPTTESEKETVKKYEHLVKEIVNEYDPIDVMDSAPDDHYDTEIRDITLRLPFAHSCEDLAEIMYVVISYWFGIGEGGLRESFRDPSIELAEKIGLCENCPLE